MLLSDRLFAPGALSVLFQPIVCVDGRHLKLHSLECLLRGPRDSNAASADVLFEYARRKRLEPQLDRACAAVSLETAAILPAHCRFSLNVSAPTLGRDPELPAFLAETARTHDIDPRNLTVEIVEHSPCWDGPGFARALDALRDMGVRIALDDVGLGYSNYRMILDAAADYLKIDRYFVQGVHADPRRRTLLESVARLADALGGTVVAEGVEHPEDLVALREIGITLVQGYLFGQPQTAAELTVAGWTCGDGIPRPSPLAA